MCIAILSPGGHQFIDTETLYAAYASNPDGAGFAWSYKGVLNTVKGIWSAKRLVKLVRRVPKMATIAIHCRIATAGMVDNTNCHPFKLGRSPYGAKATVMHNGVLPTPGSRYFSDTWHYTQDVLRPAYTSGELRNMLPEIEKFLGYGNKLVILESTGDYILANENQGTWRNDVWYSNTWGLASNRCECCNVEYYGDSPHPYYDLCMECIKEDREYEARSWEDYAAKESKPCLWGDYDSKRKIAATTYVGQCGYHI